MILILAGSLASVPVNILTGFYGTSFIMHFDRILHILQLVISILFYVSYLSFLHSYLHIREDGDKYVNELLARSQNYSKKTIEKAKNNIQYFSCKERYKSIRLSVLGMLIFGFLLGLLLLIPPRFFAHSIQLCIASIKNIFYYLGGANVVAFYE